MEYFPYEVGDAFEGGPIELAHYISLILSVGGEFTYIGDVVTIVALPGKSPVEAVAKAEPVKEVKAEPVKKVEPVKEEVKVEVEEVRVEIPEISIPPKFQPKRGRKPRASNVEEG